jgi:hypothetical protein
MMAGLRAGQPFEQGPAMDKKAKKRVQVLREKLQKLEKMLAGAKAQPDDQREIEDYEKQIAQIKKELASLTLQ